VSSKEIVVNPAVNYGSFSKVKYLSCNSLLLKAVGSRHSGIKLALTYYASTSSRPRDRVRVFHSYRFHHVISLSRQMALFVLNDCSTGNTRVMNDTFDSIIDVASKINTQYTDSHDICTHSANLKKE